MARHPQGTRQATLLALTLGCVTVAAAALALVLDPGFVAAQLSGDGQLAPATVGWLELYQSIAWGSTLVLGGAAAACVTFRGALGKATARRPLLLPRMALSLGALVAGLLAAELALALAVIGDGGAVISSNSAAYRNYSEDYLRSVADQLDARGYRETRLQRPAPPGTSRILVVGDSFVFGFGVAAAEDSFAAALERQLALGWDDSPPRFEVLNAGRPGADSAREIAVLQELMPEVKPDLVLIGYYVNDCETVAEKREYFGSRRLLPVISENLERVSQLWWLLESKVVRALEAKGLRPSYVQHLLAQTAPGSETWELHRSDLVRLLKLAGHDVALVIFPLLTDFDHYPLAALHERVAGVAREAGVPVLDLTDAFAGLSARQLMVAPYDPHLNERGLMLAARATATFLVEQDLLPHGR